LQRHHQHHRDYEKKTEYGIKQYEHGENFCVEHKETQRKRQQQLTRFQ